MNKIARLLTLLSLVFMPVRSREIRTPLTPLAAPPLRGYIHSPLVGVDQEEALDETGRGLDIVATGGAYTRRAHRAYSNEHGTDTVPLSTLFFGRSQFRLAQAFAGSTANVARNPFVNISTIAPNLEYDERGAVFGLNLDTLSYCRNYYVGFRARLPARYVTVRNNAANIAGATLSDVCLLNKENFPNNAGTSIGVPGYTYAYRLDFLAALRDADGNLVLNFANPNQGNRITFDNINITNGDLSTDAGEIAGAKVHLLGRPVNGGEPTPPFGLRDVQVNQLGVLSSDGSGLVFPGRAVFGANVNYSRLSGNAPTSILGCELVQDNLANIYLVPTIADNGAGGVKLTGTATQVNTRVQEIIRTLDTSVLDFLNDVNISLATQHQEGIGDLDTEIYVGQDILDCAYGELQFGVKFPTGKKVRGTSHPLLMPLGNNGHVELRLGALVDWPVYDWLFAHFDATYSWALDNCETIAAPFRGACVKNIGPCIDAAIDWNYFLGHFTLTFVPPCSPYLGFAIAYEPYVKQRDKVNFKGVTTAPDLMGVTQELDASVIEQRTRVISQKVITEFFYVENGYQLNAGWTHVFAGKNAPKETDFYIGFQVCF